MEKGFVTCAKHDKPVVWIGNRMECSTCAAEREIKLAQAIKQAVERE